MKIEKRGVGRPLLGPAIIGVRQNMISDKGGGGVSQFQIFSDKRGKGYSSLLTLLQKNAFLSPFYRSDKVD